MIIFWISSTEPVLFPFGCFVFDSTPSEIFQIQNQQKVICALHGVCQSKQNAPLILKIDQETKKTCGGKRIRIIAGFIPVVKQRRSEKWS